MPRRGAAARIGGTDANVFTESWDFDFGGSAGASVGRRAGSERASSRRARWSPAAGTHCLENRSDTSARVLIVSTMVLPEVVVYPERDDVFVMTQPPWSPAQGDDRLRPVFHLADGRPVPPDE